MANELVSLEDIAAEIRAEYADLWETSIERALRIGALLRKAKKQIPYGEWEHWLASAVGFTVRRAQRYIALKKTHTTELSFVAEKDKKSARSAREVELGANQLALPNKRYGVIVADPEWRFEPWSRETGMDRAADNHYPTNLTETIESRDVESIAADDCVLFLWATVPMLPQALTVMAAWGFEYKSHCVWVKDRVGTGYWFRNKHELFLIGIRGDIPAPAMGTQWASVTEAPVGKHSEKPGRFLEMVETYFPSLPKIELNCRGPARVGWDAWGNETILGIDIGVQGAAGGHDE